MPIVIFDDRIEIRSYGRLPNGITVEQLSGKHISKPVNPLIAEAFHRTGAVEVWGRGTNEVISTCKAHGVPPPTFREESGFLTVTFKAPVVAGRESAQVTPQVTPQVAPQVTPQVAPQVTPQVAPQVTPQVESILKAAMEPVSRERLQQAAGMSDREHFRKTHLKPMLEKNLLEMTIPDKPNSRLQRYRITVAGEQALKQKKQSS